MPLAFAGSSAENSLNVPGTTRLVTSALREISLNEFADHSLGSYPRKPIFCSTPSAGPLSKKPQFKSIPISDHSSATPPSMSVSCIGTLSTFQEDPDSLGKFASPPYLAPPIQLQSEEKSLSSCGEQEPSADLFMNAASANKKRSCREEAKSHSDDTKTKHSGESPRLNLLSSNNSESNSQFLTASGELEWLIEALTERCLTVPTTVQLERLCTHTVNQLCGQATYSSCLGSGYQTDEHLLGVASVQTIGLSQCTEPPSHLQLSVTDNRTSGYLQAVSILESPEHVTNSQFTNSSLVDCKHSAQHSSTYEPMEQSASEMQVETPHHKDGSDDFIMGTQSQANNPVQTLLTEEDVAALKNKCLTQKCTVQLQNCVRNSCNIRPKRKKTSRAPKPKKRRSTSADQPGTTRKACVSGLSVSRWKNKDSASTHVFRSRAKQMGRNTTVDCSITELISQHKQSKVRRACAQSGYIYLFTVRSIS